MNKYIFFHLVDFIVESNMVVCIFSTTYYFVTNYAKFSIQRTIVAADGTHSLCGLEVLVVLAQGF